MVNLNLVLSFQSFFMVSLATCIYWKGLMKVTEMSLFWGSLSSNTF